MNSLSFVQESTNENEITIINRISETISTFQIALKKEIASLQQNLKTSMDAFISTKKMFDRIDPSLKTQNIKDIYEMFSKLADYRNNISFINKKIHSYLNVFTLETKNNFILLKSKFNSNRKKDTEPLNFRSRPLTMSFEDRRTFEKMVEADNNEALEIRISQTENNIKQHESTIKMQKETIFQLGSEIERYKGELIRITSQNKTLQGKLITTKEQDKKMLDKQEADIKNLRAETENLNKILKEKENKLTELENSNRKLNTSPDVHNKLTLVKKNIFDNYSFDKNSNENSKESENSDYNKPNINLLQQKEEERFNNNLGILSNLNSQREKDLTTVLNKFLHLISICKVVKEKFKNIDLPLNVYEIFMEDYSKIQSNKEIEELKRSLNQTDKSQEKMEKIQKRLKNNLEETIKEINTYIDSSIKEKDKLKLINEGLQEAMAKRLEAEERLIDENATLQDKFKKYESKLKKPHSVANFFSAKKSKTHK